MKTKAKRKRQNINIDPELHRRLKVQAGERFKIGALADDALRIGLDQLRQIEPQDAAH